MWKRTVRTRTASQARTAHPFASRTRRPQVNYPPNTNFRPGLFRKIVQSSESAVGLNASVPGGRKHITNDATVCVGWEVRGGFAGESRAQRLLVSVGISDNDDHSLSIGRHVKRHRQLERILPRAAYDVRSKRDNSHGGCKLGTPLHRPGVLHAGRIHPGVTPPYPHPPRSAPRNTVPPHILPIFLDNATLTAAFGF